MDLLVASSIIEIDSEVGGATLSHYYSASDALTSAARDSARENHAAFAISVEASLLVWGDS